MIFAIPSDAQASSFDGWETKTDGFPQSCRVNVGYAVLVADPSIRKIEALTRYVSIRIRCVICSEPRARLNRVDSRV